MSVWLFYLALGLISGLLAGLLGIGGGIVVVPALYAHFRQLHFPDHSIMHAAVASSLTTIMFTSLLSSLQHARRGSIDWRLVRTLAPAVAMGSWLGAYMLPSIPTALLRTLVALLELMAATQMLLQWQPPNHKISQSHKSLSSAGIVIGCLSAILGIGGGTLSVPYLVFSGTGLRPAIAASATLGFPIAMLGAVTLAIAPPESTGLPSGYSSGFIYWPAVTGIAAGSLVSTSAGTYLMHRLPLAILKKIFGGLLIVMGIKLLSS